MSRANTVATTSEISAGRKNTANEANVKLDKDCEQKIAKDDLKNAISIGHGSSAPKSMVQ